MNATGANNSNVNEGNNFYNNYERDDLYPNFKTL